MIFIQRLLLVVATGFLGLSGCMHGMNEQKIVLIKPFLNPLASITLNEERNNLLPINPKEDQDKLLNLKIEEVLTQSCPLNQSPIENQQELKENKNKKYAQEEKRLQDLINDPLVTEEGKIKYERLLKDLEYFKNSDVIMIRKYEKQSVRATDAPVIDLNNK